jgi:hypothetical protein
LPIVTIKLTDEEFNQLRSKAASKGYETISDYLKSIALSEPKLLPQAEVAQKVQPEEVMPKESLQSILRAVQDMINPFTAKIDELARSIGELRERLDRLEEAIKKLPTQQPAYSYEEKRIGRTASTKKGTAIERLSVEGVVFQSELSWLNNPKAFFEKLKREGAIVIELEKEYVAVDPDFWDKFQERISGMKEKDAAKVAKSLPDKMATLFKKLLSDGKIVYDSAENSWKISI